MTQQQTLPVLAH